MRVSILILALYIGVSTGAGLAVVAYAGTWLCPYPQPFLETRRGWAADVTQRPRGDSSGIEEQRPLLRQDGRHRRPDEALLRFAPRRRGGGHCGLI